MKTLTQGQHHPYCQGTGRISTIEQFEPETGHRNNEKILISGLDAVVTRGGHTEPLWRCLPHYEKMLEQSASEKYGNHATDLGLKLAWASFQRTRGPSTVDPRLQMQLSSATTGSAQIRSRRSSFHVLNRGGAGSMPDSERIIGSRSVRDPCWEESISIAAHIKRKAGGCQQRYRWGTDPFPQQVLFRYHWRLV